MHRGRTVQRERLSFLQTAAGTVRFATGYWTRQGTNHRIVSSVPSTAEACILLFRTRPLRTLVSQPRLVHHEPTLVKDISNVDASNGHVDADDLPTPPGRAGRSHARTGRNGAHHGPDLLQRSDPKALAMAGARQASTRRLPPTILLRASRTAFEGLHPPRSVQLQRRSLPQMPGRRAGCRALDIAKRYSAASDISNRVHPFRWNS